MSEQHQSAEYLPGADVLVLGAGLAGLRAAWAAKEADPSAEVTVIGLAKGPSGSSFANVHNVLGMLVLADDEARQDFTDLVLDVAGPGFADPSLVRAMAEDSLFRFWDLVRLGAPLRSSGTGGLDLQPACFARHAKRAVVLNDMGKTFALLRRHLEDLGVTFLHGEVQDLVRDNASGRACGALLRGAQGRTAVSAGAVVMALGGPAPLFAWNMAGPSNPGTAHAMLARAGAELVNEGFMQFMWAELPARRCWPVWEIARRDMQVVGLDGLPESLPRSMADLSGQRSEHWPIAHGQADAALDAFLLSRAGHDGVVELVDQDASTLRLAPMAHAGNGGARIDIHGRTTVPGLFAAGECASGMHGANRLGGAMVLATQVFGARAGRAAVREAKDAAPTPGDVRQALAEALSLQTGTGRAGSRLPGNAPPLTTAMHRHLVMAGDEAARGILEQLERAKRRALETTGTHALEAACILVRFLVRSAVYKSDSDGAGHGMAAA